jgi:hypothetical protein
MTKSKDENNACGQEVRILTRPEKLQKLERIYSKALDIIFNQLGIDKDSVYAACQSVQTVSREINQLEKIMRMLGELEPVEPVDSKEFFGINFQLPKFDESLVDTDN